jgi:hypothetical protein
MGGKLENKSKRIAKKGREGGEGKGVVKRGAKIDI